MLHHQDFEQKIYVLEVNPRASRTVPFVAKATGVPLVKVAARVMCGATLATLVVGPFEFDRPMWLWLIPVMIGLTLLIGRKSLAGLDSAWKVIALIVRVIVSSAHAVSR